MSEHTPRVSVVVPNFNYARYLPVRLKSILDQSFKDFEIIYIDDASSDHSVDIAKEYLRNRDAQILVNRENSGCVFPLWNKGFSLARGEFVWIAESDDCADPGFLEQLVPILAGDRNLGLAYCQSLLVDEHDRETGTMLSYTDRLWPGRWAQSFRARGRDEAARYLVHRNTIPNASAVLFRREAFMETGGVPPGVNLCGDWMTYVGIMRKWDLFFLAKNLNYFRLHSQTQRMRMSGNPEELRESYQVLKYVLENYPVKRKDRHRALESRMYLWVDLALKRSWGMMHPRMAGIRDIVPRADPGFACRFRKKRLFRRLKKFIPRGILSTRK